MLPATARPDDFVEVIHEGCEWFGFIGKIIKMDSHEATVQIFDKTLVFKHSQLKLKARKGTKTYEALREMADEQEVKRLTAEDYDDLINLAIDWKDWEYAQELVARKQALTKSKRRV